MRTRLKALLLLSFCAQTAGVLACQEQPLRNAEPLDGVVADLERYIPARMQQAGIPGLAVALVRDGQVAYAKGFGVANRISGRPVKATTVFEVASNSKVVTTYTALRLVDQGRLALDEPLKASLARPWLPSTPYANGITLRHLASHSAGLTDNLLPVDKSIIFEPGSAFSYSGVGFLYMQEVIEQVTGASLEDAARTLVFEPLGMASSSFVNRAGLTRDMANGHMGYAFALSSFLVPFSTAFIVIMLVGATVRRVRAGTWRPSGKLMAGSAVAAAPATIALVYVMLGDALPNLALLIVLVAALFGAVFGVAVMLARMIPVHFPLNPKHRRALSLVWMIASFVALSGLSWMIDGPIPSGLSPPPSAVGSLRTSAPDLAAFLAELAAPRLLDQETSVQLQTPQIAINEDFSWGLGLGVQHSDQGPALWQNGMTFGFRSVMVIYPAHQWGVVVLTNSHDGLPVAYDIAARALGGKADWSFF